MWVVQEQSSNRYSTKSIAIRTWSIRHAQPAASSTKNVEARSCKIYGRECRRNQKGWGNINGVLQCTQILNVDETHKQQRFLAIKDTLALTQRLCMIFVPIAACQYQQF